MLLSENFIKLQGKNIGMPLFGTKTSPKLDVVTGVAAFPSINTAVLKVDDKLVVFSPTYLLGKHGAGTGEAGSKFLELKAAMQLLQVLKANLSSRKLVGDRVELREIDIGVTTGYDALVEVSPALWARLPKRQLRKERPEKVGILYVDRGAIPQTTLMNFILVKFDPKYGQGIELLFKQKYGGNVGFEDFADVYVILTMFPGRYAPPASDAVFWSRHVLLREVDGLP